MHIPTCGYDHKGCSQLFSQLLYHFYNYSRQAVEMFVSIIFITVTIASLTTLIRETSILNQNYHLPCISPLFSLCKFLKINLEPMLIPIMLALCSMLSLLYWHNRLVPTNSKYSGMELPNQKMKVVFTKQQILSIPEQNIKAFFTYLKP